MFVYVFLRVPCEIISVSSKSNFSNFLKGDVDGGEPGKMETIRRRLMQPQHAR